jgi:lysophospholipase
MTDRRAIPTDMQIDRWPAADGWPLRRFVRAPAAGAVPRGSILFQSGRGDFMEKYLEALDAWHQAGWHLTGFDWRGQGGSGRFLADPDIGHAASLDPLLADLAAFVPGWIASTPGPHVLIGHSMGGHLVLRLLAEARPPVAAAVLVAPMLGLATPPGVAEFVSNAALWLRMSERRAWPGNSEAMHRQANLTGSPERYADEAWWKENSPELAIGTPSWGWLAAALASIDKVNRARLEDVTTPLLILAARHDRLVSTAAIERTAARLPDAELRMFADGGHELLRDADAVRLPAMAAIDDFLAARAPAA